MRFIVSTSPDTVCLEVFYPQLSLMHYKISVAAAKPRAVVPC